MVQMEGFGAITEKLRRSTVQVNSAAGGQGSGIIVSPDGTIVTNAHVATSNNLSVQLWDSTRSPAELLHRDAGRDLAILRIAKSQLPAATLANSDSLRVGELVIAIGNPFGFVGALTTGVIHAIGPVTGLGPVKWIQDDVQLAPGNSGGPLANARGEVIGVNTMVAAGVGLAVPSNSVSRLLQRRTLPPPLGVTLRPVELAMAAKAQLGLAILEVAKNGAAQGASLLPGDIIIGVDNRPFETLEDFERAFDGVGERVIRLQFVRGDPAKVRAVAVRLGAPGRAAA